MSYQSLFLILSYIYPFTLIGESIYYAIKKDNERFHATIDNDLKKVNILNYDYSRYINNHKKLSMIFGLILLFFITVLTICEYKKIVFIISLFMFIILRFLINFLSQVQELK